MSFFKTAELELIKECALPPEKETFHVSPVISELLYTSDRVLFILSLSDGSVYLCLLYLGERVIKCVILDHNSPNNEEPWISM